MHRGSPSCSKSYWGPIGFFGVVVVDFIWSGIFSIISVDWDQTDPWSRRVETHSPHLWLGPKHSRTIFGTVGSNVTFLLCTYNRWVHCYLWAEICSGIILGSGCPRVGISRSTGSRIIIVWWFPVVATIMVVSTFTSIIARYIALAMGVSWRDDSIGLFMISPLGGPSGMIGITIITRSCWCHYEKDNFVFPSYTSEGLRGHSITFCFFEYYIKRCMLSGFCLVLSKWIDHVDR